MAASKLKVNFHRIPLNSGGYDARGQYYGSERTGSYSHSPVSLLYEAEVHDGKTYVTSFRFRARDRDHAKQVLDAEMRRLGYGR